MKKILTLIGAAWLTKKVVGTAFKLGELHSEYQAAKGFYRAVKFISDDIEKNCKEEDE